MCGQQGPHEDSPGLFECGALLLRQAHDQNADRADSGVIQAAERGPRDHCQARSDTCGAEYAKTSRPDNADRADSGVTQAAERGPGDHSQTRSGTSGGACAKTSRSDTRHGRKDSSATSKEIALCLNSAFSSEIPGTKTGAKRRSA